MRWPPPPSTFIRHLSPQVTGAAAHSCKEAVADWSRYCTGSERIGQTGLGISQARRISCLHEWPMFAVIGTRSCFRFENSSWNSGVWHSAGYHRKVSFVVPRRTQEHKDLFPRVCGPEIMKITSPIIALPKVTRGLILISYRGALLSTLLHATVYVFYTICWMY
jgi:hypothetical protein